MSVTKLHLRKALHFTYLPYKPRIAALKKDVYNSKKKLLKTDEPAGDFPIPFWADVRRHLAGRADLTKQIEIRVEANRRRRRLYPRYKRAFFKWWDEDRQGRYEPFEVAERSASAHLFVPELEATFKIENVLVLKVRGGSNRILYPYFSEEPVLKGEGVRVALWFLKQTLNQFSPEDLRILDVLRSRSFGMREVPLEGNERELFLGKYKRVMEDWDRLSKTP